MTGDVRLDVDVGTGEFFGEEVMAHQADQDMGVVVRALAKVRAVECWSLAAHCCCCCCC